jgi:hypothetical protein
VRNLVPNSNLTWFLPIPLLTPGMTVVDPRPALWLLDNQTSTTRNMRDKWILANPQSLGTSIIHSQTTTKL